MNNTRGLQNTRGIVFRSTEFKETSLVVQIYTELFGIQSYIINSVRKKHSRIHPGIFQPLTPVDLVAYHKDRPGLQRISDIRPNPPLSNIPFDISKTSMIFFLDEVLAKSIKEEEANPGLFEFIFNSILWLDEPHPPGNDFHLIFLMALSRHLGFFPRNNYDTSKEIFNLRDGIFQETFPDHPHFIIAPFSKYFSELIPADFSFMLNLSSNDRRTMISYMLEYYALHVDGFGNIKSHKILEQVFN